MTDAAAANVATPPLTSGSGVPAIVREWLPTAFAAAHPATVEGLWAALMSVRNVIGLLVTGFFMAADTIGADDSTATMWALFTHYHWWIAVIAIYFPAAKAKTAFGKAKSPSA